MLPPLADILALRVDPQLQPALVERLRASGMFDVVHQPTLEWTYATRALPGGPPSPPASRGSGDPSPAITFAEGADLVSASGSGWLPDLDRALENPAARLRRWPGDFTFVRWSPQGDASVVRSCGGLVPIYVTRSSGTVAIATRLDLLVRFVLDRPRFDHLTMGLWLSGFPGFPDGRSFLADVAVVPRGNVLRIPSGDASWSTVQYWGPRPETLARVPRRDEHHPRQLRELLLNHLDRHLDASGTNLISLSGGVDSAALTALAGGTLNRPIATVSALPADPAERAHERSYIDPLVREVGVVFAHDFQLDEGSYLRILEQAPIVGVPVTHPVLCALPGLAGESRISVLLGGEFADEICGSWFTWPDWLVHTSLRWALRHPRSMPFQPRNLAHLAAHRAKLYARDPPIPYPATLLPVLHEDVQAEYSEWVARRDARRAADARPLAYLALRTEMDAFLAMNWEVCSVCSVRRCVPFFSRELLELTFSCHPAELIGPGTKRLLRRGLVGDVPERNLGRADKGAWALAPSPQPIREPVDDLARGLLRDDMLGGVDGQMPHRERIALRVLSVYGASLRFATAHGP